MKMRTILYLVFCLLLTSCNLPGSDGNTDDQAQIETIVAATAHVLTLQSGSSTQTFLPASTDFLQPTITLTKAPEISSTPEPGFGSISGSISSYPYGSVPQLAIVALEQQAPYHYWYLITNAGNTYFSMDGYISSGRYQVVAYDPSGHTGGCLTIVEVKNNEMVVCNIIDWSGTYPAKPVGVP